MAPRGHAEVDRAPSRARLRSVANEDPNMMVQRLALTAVLALASTAGICTRTYNYTNPSPIPTPTPAPVANLIEFRVLGNVGNVPVLIKMTNSIDGVTALTAVSLPFVASVKSLDASI